MHPWEVIFRILLVFAPYIGYVAQYFEIRKTNSIEGYAPLVSLILLTSNTLRIYYFLGEQYMLALLFQAILGVVVHFALLIKVLDVHTSHVVSGRQEDVLFGASVSSPGLPFDPNAAVEDAGGKPAEAVAGAPVDTPYGVNADVPSGDLTMNGREAANPPPRSAISAAFSHVLHFLLRVEEALEENLLQHTAREFTYNFFLAALAALILVVLYYASFGRFWHHAPEIVGYLSTGIEAMLVVPQILRNARRRSTSGLSFLLILTWVGGDVIKVIYFTYAKQSLPFIVCGIFQIALDVVVVGQLIYYRFYLRRDAEERSEQAATEVQPPVHEPLDTRTPDARGPTVM